MKNLSSPEKIYIGLVLFAIAGTLLSHFTGIDPGPIAPISSALIIFVAVFCLYRILAKTLPPATAARTLIIIFAFGTASELIGLYTSFPFGSYSYTSNWLPILPLPGGKSFPLLLPFAWTMIVGSVCLITQSNRPNSVWKPVAFAALLATAVDFVMEPVMVDALGYWQWHSPTHFFSAPWSNAAGWFLVSLFAATPLTISLANAKNRVRSETGAIVLAGHLLLMSVLAATHLDNRQSILVLLGIVTLIAGIVTLAGLKRTQLPLRGSADDP